MCLILGYQDTTGKKKKRKEKKKEKRKKGKRTALSHHCVPTALPEA